VRVNLPSPDAFAYNRENEAASRRAIEKAFGTILSVVPGTGVPSAPPATAASAGKVGTITWDATHLYVCIAANTWVRSLLAAW